MTDSPTPSKCTCCGQQMRATDAIERLQSQLAARDAELAEQCRLNAMGQEREAKLMAELTTLRKTVSELTHNQRIQDSATAAVMERAEKAEAELAEARVRESWQTDQRLALAVKLEQAEARAAAVENWLDNNMTFYNTAESPAPVLASVSKRIWYHATDDQDSYPFSKIAMQGGRDA